MWERIRHILIKELRQAFREPRMRALLIAPPLLQLLIFGYAVNLDIENARLAWIDRDGSSQSRDLYHRFAGSPNFEIAFHPADDREAQLLLDRGRVQAIVHVPPGFGRDILRGKETEIQVLLDGTNSNSAGIIASYTANIIARYSAQAVAHTMDGALVGRTEAGAVDRRMAAVSAESRVWFNPDLRSRNFYVPGVIVNIILIVTTMLTALAIVREKEIGTMEQLMVTPIRPVELMIGKMLPFALVGLVNTAMITVAAFLVFKVPFEGSVLVLGISACLFLLTTLGTGLLISTVSHTQQQAMMASFFFVLPAIMLSGFAFPIRNMPGPVQYLSYLNPMRYFIDIVRGVFLKGSGFDIHWPEMAAMLLFGVAIIAFSALRFHKKLE
jgi:ABC-2 type transport system permease protein